MSLWLAVQQPELVSALILDAPAAIRPEGARPPSGTPAEMARMLFAHPERVPPLPRGAAGGPRPDPGPGARGCAGRRATAISNAG